MNKSKNNAQKNTSPKRKSKSYVLVHAISGALCLCAAIAVFIAMLIEHIWVLIFPALFALFLGLIEIASSRSVQKHGAKVMPRQVIFPTVKLWKDNGIDPNDIKYRIQRKSERH